MKQTNPTTEKQTVQHNTANNTTSH